MAIKRGYEDTVMMGAAGATATTPILCRIDADAGNKLEMDDVTCAGDGTSLPVTRSEPVSATRELSFTMLINTEATAYATLNAAAKAGDAVALAHGDFDEDCYVDVTVNRPLKGKQTATVTVVGTKERTA